MTFKRLGSLLTAALLFNLTLASGDHACATHESHARGPAAHAESQEHGDLQSHDQSGVEDERCEVPARPDCCRAQASCAVNVLLDTDVVTVNQSPRHAPATLPGTDIPRSRTQSPEPPPPKA